MNWDNPDPREFSAEENISVYMSTLVKETATLHKVLSKYLSSDTLKKVMADVFRTYALKLEDDLKKLDLFSSSAKNRYRLLRVGSGGLINELSPSSKKKAVDGSSVLHFENVSFGRH